MAYLVIRGATRSEEAAAEEAPEFPFDEGRRPTPSPRRLTPHGVKWHSASMAEFKVRNLDDRIASALRTRARAHGVSVEEEVRRLLSESVAKKREAFARRAAASRAATRRARKRRATDSTVLIRGERDAWG